MARPILRSATCRARVSPRRSGALLLALAGVLTAAAVGVGFGASPASAGPEGRRVPEVIDLPVAAAQSELFAAGFTAVIEQVPGEPDGTVARQVPGGFALAAGGNVTIYVRRSKSATPLPTGPTLPPPTGPTLPPPTGPSLPPPSGEILRLPSVVGRSEAEATDMLRPWRVTITSVEGTPQNEGLVVRQDPAAGAPHAAGAVVEITVARGAAANAPGTAAIPNVVGLPQDAAQQALAAGRLVPLVNLVAGDPNKAGLVISQEPAAGTVVARDSNVVINVGRAAASTLAEVETPDVTRLSELDARARLSALGLGFSVTDRLAAAEAAGHVLEQDPAPGTRLQRGRSVALIIGRALLIPIRIPETVGMDAAAGRRALEDAGFVIEEVPANTLPSNAGRVIAMEPPAGAQLTRGAAVRLTVGRTAGPIPMSGSVPTVVGRTESEARRELSAAGYGARVTQVVGNPAEVGRVRAQSPLPGMPAPRGTDVLLEVVAGGGIVPPSAGPGVQIANYVGMDLAAAEQDIRGRGLQLAVQFVTATPEGRIVSQSPAPGTPVAVGGVVSLTVAKAPVLGAVVLIYPEDKTSLPRNHGVTFSWHAVPGADDYEFETQVYQDDKWVPGAKGVMRETYIQFKRPERLIHVWHVRARKAGGAILGPWSPWWRLTIY